MKTSEYLLRMSRPRYCIKGPSNEIGSKSTKYHVYLGHIVFLNDKSFLTLEVWQIGMQTDSSIFRKCGRCRSTGVTRAKWWTSFEVFHTCIFLWLDKFNKIKFTKKFQRLNQRLNPDCLVFSHSNHYTGMFSVFVWGYNSFNSSNQIKIFSFLKTLHLHLDLLV